MAKLPGKRPPVIAKGKQEIDKPDEAPKKEKEPVDPESYDLDPLEVKETRKQKTKRINKPWSPGVKHGDQEIPEDAKQDELKRREEIRIVQELLQRKRAAEEYQAYCEYVLGLTLARHHKAICEGVERVLSGETKRLLVTAPPGSAKSTYTTIGLPGYYVGRCFKENRKGLIISASHNFELAEDFGRKVKNIVKDDVYSNVFPGLKIPHDSSANRRWATNYGAEYLAVGVNTGIAGRRGTIGIIDDPYPSRKDAESPAYRKAVQDWFYNDFQTRLHPGSPIILIQTRWHPEDLAGHLLERQEAGENMGYEWEHLNFEAIYEGPEPDPIGREIGEPLWPEWQPLDELLRIRNSFPDFRDWLSLYQQKPSNPTGNLIGKEYIRYYRDLPEDVAYYIQTWDTASSTTKRAAYSVCLTIAVTRNRDYYVVDMFRDKVEFPKLIREFRDRYAAYPVARVYIENKQTGSSLIQTYRGKGYNIFPCEPRGQGDKEVRFEEITPVMEAGRFFIPVAAPWRKDFESEVMQFPFSPRADIPDALSQAIKKEEDRVRRRVRRGMATVRT